MLRTGRQALIGELAVYPDATLLARAAAEAFVRAAEAALTTQGRFIVALSGGNTPRALYALLASEEYLPLVDWTQTYVFWGDERCVPPDHPDSNYRMARELLLDYVPIPMGNIYRIYGEADPSLAADAYEFRLRRFFEGRVEGAPRARFDLVLLGIGDDGHTASLFPNTAALDVTDRWVAAHYVDKLGAWRITLTPLALNAAAEIQFMISGETKAPALREILTGERQPRRYPAQLIEPDDGRVLWLVDRAVASLLPGM